MDANMSAEQFTLIVGKRGGLKTVRGMYKQLLLSSLYIPCHFRTIRVKVG